MLRLLQRVMSVMVVGVLAAGISGTGNLVLAQDEPAAETVAEAPAITVDVAFGSGVDRATRSLEGKSTAFAADGFPAEGGQVYCLTRIANMAAPATVFHVWYHEGKTKARVELNVGSATWRTWSSKRILPAWTGNWEVKVLDADGMVLASAGFTVE